MHRLLNMTKSEGIKQKKQGWFYSREYYIYIFTIISKGAAFLLQGLTHNEEAKLRRYNLKLKE